MVTQKQYFNHSIYTNLEFEEEYFQPFLQLVINDETLVVDILEKWKKLNPGKKFNNMSALTSSALRALIKKYVDDNKEKLLLPKENIVALKEKGKKKSKEKTIEEPELNYYCPECPYNDNKEECLLRQKDCVDAGRLIKPKWMREGNEKNNSQN